MAMDRIRFDKIQVQIYLLTHYPIQTQKLKADSNPMDFRSVSDFTEPQKLNGYNFEADQNQSSINSKMKAINI